MSGMEFSAEQIRRSVVQRLEDLRRAGVTHWKRIAPVVPNPAPQAGIGIGQASMPVKDRVALIAGSPPALGTTAVSRGSDFTADRGARGMPPVPVGKTVSDETTASRLLEKPASSVNLLSESESSELAKKKATVPVPSPCATFQPLDLSLKDRITGLAALAARVSQCTRCHELATTRTQTVFGVGNPEAKILFVGEAPGADEDAQGEPFVGKAGQLLNDIVKACRLRREDIYICNVLRCRPPGNRLPAPDEAANCREYLDGQIAHVNPDYIVCWGASAAQNLLAMTDPIGKLRRRFHVYGRAKVLCTYHPAYLLRNPAAKKDVWEDMKLLFLDMGIDLAAKK